MPFANRWITSTMFGQVREVRRTVGTLTCRIRPVRFGVGFHYVILNRIGVDELMVAHGREATVNDCKERCDSYVDAVSHGLYTDN